MGGENSDAMAGNYWDATDNGVSTAVRKRAKPALRNTSVSKFGPACALMEHRLAQPLDNAVGLRVTSHASGVVDVLQREL